jgi:ABC-type transporter Mla MlaB component
MATAELDEAIRSVSTGQTVVMNLAALGKVDTSALTVLLQLTRQAHQCGIKLVWSGMPPALLELAKLSSVDALLPTA